MVNNIGLEIDLLPVERGKKSGDCIALRYGNLVIGGDEQRVFVIDGGYAANAKSLKKHLKTYYNCLDKNGKIRIDIVFLTHPDLDHVEGLINLFNDIEINVINLITMIPWKIMDVSWYKDERITENSLESRLKEAFEKLNELVKIAESKKIKIIQIDKLINPLYYHGAIITTLGPCSIFYKECIANSEKTPDKDSGVPTMPTTTFSQEKLDDEEDYIRNHIKLDETENTSPINESSHIFLFEYNGHKILFTGDAGKIALGNAILYAKSAEIDLSNIDIIKIPHHGSRKNISFEILDELITSGFTRCYISCASNDVGHHPSKRLVNLLIEKGARVFTTSGSTLHHGWNEPKRAGWFRIDPMQEFSSIEKL